MEKIKSVLQAELDATTFEIAKSENAEAQQSATSDSVACDNINWEQRRWEMANNLYFWNVFVGKWKDAIEQADVLIKEYKQSLSKEE